MATSHVKKQVVIDKMVQEMSEATVAIVTDYRGLTMARLADIRNALYPHNATVTVMKNTLLKRAIKGTAMDGMADYLKGPTAIVYGKGDMVEPVKILRDYLKKNKLDKNHELRGGFVDGKAINAAEVIDLAEMPSLDELRAKLLGCIAGPGQRLVMALNSQNQALVISLDQIAKQKQGA